MFETTYDEATKKATNKTYPLEDYPNAKVPSYLEDMKELVNKFNNGLQMRVAHAMKITASRKSVEFNKNLVKSSLLLLIKHKSTLRNGTYHFTACLKGLADLLLKKKVKLTEDEIKALQGEMTVFVHTVFGKEKRAVKCINCDEFKYKMVNMNQQLYMRHSKLWMLVNSVLFQKVLFDSEQPQEAQVSEWVNPCELIDLSHLSETFELCYIQGAE
jgi:hypothetical protein